MFLLFAFARRYRRENCRSSYGHTTVNPPHPIRTAKLSTVGPNQYYGGGPRGNLGCCMAFLIILLSLPSDAECMPDSDRRALRAPLVERVAVNH